MTDECKSEGQPDKQCDDVLELSSLINFTVNVLTVVQKKKCYKTFSMKSQFKTVINHTPCAHFLNAEGGNPHCTHLCIPSDCAVPTS